MISKDRVGGSFQRVRESFQKYEKNPWAEDFNLQKSAKFGNTLKDFGMKQQSSLMIV